LAQQWLMEKEIYTTCKAFDTVQAKWTDSDGISHDELLFVGTDLVNVDGDESNRLCIGTVDIDNGELCDPDNDVEITPPSQVSQWAKEHWLKASMCNEVWLLMNSSRFGAVLFNLVTLEVAEPMDIPNNGIFEVKANRDSDCVYVREASPDAACHTIRCYKMTEDRELVETYPPIAIPDRGPEAFDAQELLDVDFHLEVVTLRGYNYTHFIDGKSGRILRRIRMQERTKIVMLPGTGLYAISQNHELPKFFVVPPAM
ncbi:MAG: hypothetical protein SGILL_010771, partial [Bacillariaceae sp.]